MEYQLIRSERRKTIALQVRNGEVIVRAPTRVDLAYIEQLLQLKSPWLAQKLAQQKQRSLQSVDFSQAFLTQTPGNAPTVYIDGIAHKVKVAFGPATVMHNKSQQDLTVVLNPRYQQLPLQSELILTKVKAQIEAWFKSSIESYVAQKLACFSASIPYQPAAFKVRKYKARWGSCNSRRELSFNFLLKQLPPWVVDYVIIHELCHLKHMNHSAKFWQLVASYCPTFQDAKHWIKQHQAYLSWH
ncbi:M48 family metallopeptidase [Colwellia chukchiensis]|uniref:M48 family metallopeptidase n=1 Tax=Colwellia chukchiensis TaxID=641665 RepID=UPI001301A5E5|nr:SprT family zinc-dependent metalloprotease [Colwellia chukchiensis]